jgi:hypothetical protein
MVLHDKDARWNDECLRVREIFKSGFVRTADLRGRCAWAGRLIRNAIAKRDRSGSFVVLCPLRCRSMIRKVLQVRGECTSTREAREKVCAWARKEDRAIDPGREGSALARLFSRGQKRH